MNNQRFMGWQLIIWFTGYWLSFFDSIKNGLVLSTVKVEYCTLLIVQVRVLGNSVPCPGVCMREHLLPGWERNQWCLQSPLSPLLAGWFKGLNIILPRWYGLSQPWEQPPQSPLHILNCPALWWEASGSPSDLPVCPGEEGQFGDGGGAGWPVTKKRRPSSSIQLYRHNPDPSKAWSVSQPWGYDDYFRNPD